MGYFKPLTPTSAGFAQVFDTSSFQEEARQERLYRQERLNKSMLEYDPKGMHKSHLAAYSQLMNDYNKRVGEISGALMKGDPEAHLEKRSLENRIKNVVAGSIQYNQDVGKSRPMVLENESYMNPENERLLDQLENITWSTEQVINGDAFIPAMTNLSRNYMVDEDAIMSELRSGYMTEDTELVKDAEPGFDAERTMTRLANKEAEAYLKDKYNERTRDGGDLRHKYKTEDEFVNTMKERIVTQEKLDYRRQPKITTKEPTQIEKKEQNAILKVEGGSGILAQYSKETMQPVKDEKTGELVATPTAGTKQPTELYATDVYSITAPSGDRGIRFTAQLKSGIDLTTGKEEGFPEGVNTFEVDKTAWMYRNEHPDKEAIHIRRKDGSVEVVEYGEYLPSKDEVDPKMSAVEWNQITRQHGFKERQAARVRASVDPTDIEKYVLNNLDSLKGKRGEDVTKGELIKQIANERRAQGWKLVDYSWIERDMAEAYAMQYAVPIDQYYERMKDFNDHPIIY